MTSFLRLGVTQDQCIFPTAKLQLFQAVNSSRTEILLEIDRLKASTMNLLSKLWNYLYTKKPAEVTENEAVSPLVQLGFDMQVPIVNSLGQLVQTNAFS